MKITVEGKPERVVRKKADPQGRVTLGAEYANREVTVLIVEPED